MTGIKTESKIHPAVAEMADYLSGRLSGKEKERIEDHISSCEGCLETVVSAYESVKTFGKKSSLQKGNIVKKTNLYLMLALISFALSFTVPRFFLQFLVATLILGIKWVADAKSAKMLIMIYEAWKKGGVSEASRILNALDAESKNRL